MKRILIVNVNWLGDTLFATPLIRAVREKYPGAYIAILTHPRCYKMLEGNPHINEIIIYDEKKQHRSLLSRFSIISHLRSEKFDTAFILKKSLSRTLLLLFSKIPRRIGYGSKRAGFLLTKKAKAPHKGLHKVEYFLNLARAAGIEAENKNYEIFISDSDVMNGEEILRDAGIKDKKFIVLNAGGNWNPKRWPAENFAELGDRIAEKIGAHVVLTGAEKDLVLAEKISGLMKHKPYILCGKTDLKTLGAIFKKAMCVISNDSGPMHLAVAMKAKVIALFGPTSPKLTGPYGKGSYRVIWKTETLEGCEAPCYDVTCSDNRCMSAITVDEVFKEAQDFINAGNR
jgi:heptosyltransferase I